MVHNINHPRSPPTHYHFHSNQDSSVKLDDNKDNIQMHFSLTALGLFKNIANLKKKASPEFPQFQARVKAYDSVKQQAETYLPRKCRPGFRIMYQFLNVPSEYSLRS